MALYIGTSPCRSMEASLKFSKKFNELTQITKNLAAPQSAQIGRKVESSEVIGSLTLCGFKEVVCHPQAHPRGAEFKSNPSARKCRNVA